MQRTLDSNDGANFTSTETKEIIVYRDIPSFFIKLHLRKLKKIELIF